MNAKQSYIQFGGHLCIHEKETGCQPSVWSCIKHGLPRHLVQELNIGTVTHVVEKT